MMGFLTDFFNEFNRVTEEIEEGRRRVEEEMNRFNELQIQRQNQIQQAAEQQREMMRQFLGL